MRWCVLVLVVTACGSSRPPAKERDARARDEVVAAPPSSIPTVTIDGTVERYRGAVAYAETPSQLQVILMPDPTSCDDLQADLIAGGELTLEVLEQLDEHGAIRWGLARAETGDLAAEAGPERPVVELVSIDAPGGRVHLELHAELQVGLSNTRIAIDGAIDVERCPSKATAPAPPQPDAFLEIEGHRLPIVGAGLVVGPGGHQLTVSTVAIRCAPLGKPGHLGASSAVWSDDRPTVKVEIGSRDGGKPVTLMSGTWMPAPADGDGLRYAPEVPPAGVDEVRLELSGRADLRGYDTSWTGTMVAAVCR